MQVLAFSGGKDSTCLALAMAEDGEDFVLFFTPTGRELPECLAHIARVVALTGKKLVVRTAGVGLSELIRRQNALPNSQMRWCTRMLKIEPCKAFLLENPGSVLLVGLRADEEEREGMWGEFASYRYPLREKGWGEPEVWAYLEARGVTVPDRTDCDYCYDQRLGEWWRLWKEHPDRWAEAEALEEATGFTFRSRTRDAWPSSLKGLRERFEAGDVPTRGRHGIIPMPLFDGYDVPKRERCRVCSL